MPCCLKEFKNKAKNLSKERQTRSQWGPLMTFWLVPQWIVLKLLLYVIFVVIIVIVGSVYMMCVAHSGITNGNENFCCIWCNTFIVSPVLNKLLNEMNGIKNILRGTEKTLWEAETH